MKRLPLPKKILLAFFLLTFSLNLFTTSVNADGMVMELPDNPYTSQWDYSDEKSQQAFINFENGLERLIVGIELEETKRDLVWILPVPANPQEVIVDILTKLPKLSGREIPEKAKYDLQETLTPLRNTQIYPLFVSVYEDQNFGIRTGGFEIPSLSLGSLKEFSRPEPDVIVYDRLEKEGMTAEIITAKTANGLDDYLKSKGLKMETGSIPALSNYLGKNFSFVISWISPGNFVISEEEVKWQLYSYINQPSQYPKLTNFLSQLRKKYPDLEKAYRESNYAMGQFLESPAGEIPFNELYLAIQANPSLLELKNSIKNDFQPSQRGLLLTFPAEKIYYPLIPTSVYGSKTVPATIRVIGNFSPKLPKLLRNFSSVSYYVEDYPLFDPSLEDFFGNLPVRFSDSSKTTTLKPWVSITPQPMKYTKVEISAPSKYLSEDLWFSKGVPLKVHLADLISNHRSITYWFLLILTSTLSSFLAGMICFKNLLNRKGLIKLGLIGLFNCLSVIGFAIATFFLRTKEIAVEERKIIQELKEKGYPVRYLETADIRKFLFIPLFSVIFLLISGGLVKLIQVIL